MTTDPNPTTIPDSPWHPHGPVPYVRVEHWGDRERAAYLMHDIQVNGIREIDDDPWVGEFLVKLLWGEIMRSAKNDAR